MEALFLLVSMLRSALRNRTALAHENLALREQLAILNRTIHARCGPIREFIQAPRRFIRCRCCQGDRAHLPLYRRAPGTAEPFRSAPPEAPVYLNANYPLRRTQRVGVLARPRRQSLQEMHAAAALPLPSSHRLGRSGSRMSGRARARNWTFPF